MRRAATERHYCREYVALAAHARLGKMPARVRAAMFSDTPLFDAQLRVCLRFMPRA